MFCISGAAEDLLVGRALVGVLEPKWSDCFVCRMLITYMKHNTYTYMHVTHFQFLIIIRNFAMPDAPIHFMIPGSE